MSTLQDLDARISAARAKEQEALQAEAQRLRQERSARQQIVQSQQNIVALEQERALKAFTDRNKVAQVIAQEIEARGRTLIAALDAFDVPRAIEITRSMAAAQDRLAKYNAETLPLLEPIRAHVWDSAARQVQESHRIPPHSNPAFQNPLLQSKEYQYAETTGLWQAEMVRFEQQIPAPTDYKSRLRAWVRAAEPGLESQIRQGIGFAVTGDHSMILS